MYNIVRYVYHPTSKFYQLIFTTIRSIKLTDTENKVRVFNYKNVPYNRIYNINNLYTIATIDFGSNRKIHDYKF